MIERGYRAGGGRSSVQNAVAMDVGDDGAPPTKVLIAMDCLCDYHGCYLANRALDVPGVAVVHVLSDYLATYLQATGAASAADVDLRRSPSSEEEARLFREAIGGPNVEVVAVFCESDSGLRDAEELRELLSVTCQDTPVIHEPRRDKSLMYTAVSEAGLYVAKSQLCESCEDATEFAKAMLQTKSHVVVKPFRGVASESVTLCKTEREVIDAWRKITSSQIFGSSERHSNVLVQEFLDGVEYALDTVSRDGQHKVLAVWRYVKKPANGASFCYYKTELVDSSLDGNVASICDYAVKALDALGVRWGICHNEFIFQENSGPALVEVNTRQHNMDFLPLVMSCIGYNVFDIFLLALFFGEEQWSAVPNIPSLRNFGCMVHLVNSASGILVNNHHIDDLADLPSVLEYEVYGPFRTKGETITPTIDIRTDAGWAQLINPDREELERDYSLIEKWMETMFETSMPAQ